LRRIAKEGGSQEKIKCVFRERVSKRAGGEVILIRVSPSTVFKDSLALVWRRGGFGEKKGGRPHELPEK